MPLKQCKTPCERMCHRIFSREMVSVNNRYQEQTRHLTREYEDCMAFCKTQN
jgi:hypothetical protein